MSPSSISVGKRIRTWAARAEAGALPSWTISLPTASFRRAECPHQSSSARTSASPPIGLWPTGWESRVWKSTSNLNGFTNDTDTMKAYLKTMGPLEVGIWAGHDLYAFASGHQDELPRAERMGLRPSRSCWSAIRTMRAIPTGGYWIIKNSWGTRQKVAERLRLHPLRQHRNSQ